ncbi:MAG: sulfite exporter TauE/SafE family protein [Methyloprofundus sp.]|nr:sulfite exporter TauE/SafE family protein [Methyloprofundus sp.]MDT8424908.1 sulfite exporter TauE/SafE family protein [Methyloprofundus sp.]
MPVDILATLLLTTVIQSLFGVGILLFGTPLMLLLGYEFSYALSVLLPTSIAVNILQVLKHYSYIDLRLYKNVLLYSIPFIVLCLFIITNIQLNLGLIIGIFLIFVALKSFSPRIDQALNAIMGHEKLYLVSMGIVHGITNLGGSLLTALAHKQNQPKNITRATIAICYATFALFQLLTLYFIGYEGGMPHADNMLLLQTSIVVFLLTEEFIYSQIDNKRYTQLFAIFLALSGVLLLLKSLNS